MYTLRAYQKKAIDEFDSLRATKSRLLMVLPTGAGKTVAFSSIAKRFVDNNQRVLILTHRIELAKQAIEKLCGFGLNPTSYTSEVKHHSGLTVGMVETAKNEKSLLGKFDLIIIDEAHRGEFNKAFLSIPQNTLILGVTATPIAAKNPLLSMSTSRMTVSQLVERAKIGSRDGVSYKVGWCKHQILARCRTSEQVYQELTELQKMVGEADDYAIYWTNRWQEEGYR